MCQILNIDQFRAIPSIQQQKEKRDEIVRQEVMRLYEHEPHELVAKACEAASKALERDASFEEALDSARVAMLFGRNIGETK